MTRPIHRIVVSRDGKPDEVLEGEAVIVLALTEHANAEGQNKVEMFGRANGDATTEMAASLLVHIADEFGPEGVMRVTEAIGRRSRHVAVTQARAEPGGRVH